MKRITKFIIFKVVELAAAFIVWWGLSLYGYWIDSLFEPVLTDGNMLEKWLEAPFFGFAGIFLPLAVLFWSGIGIYHWIKWNWEKVG
uniref:Uncharacterized protein n=1 Tax=viral metagenome TaxID=1070528 RepID=A0A6H1ZBV4_9ZZZZ